MHTLSVIQLWTMICTLASKMSRSWMMQLDASVLPDIDMCTTQSSVVICLGAWVTTFHQHLSCLYWELCITSIPASMTLTCSIHITYRWWISTSPTPFTRKNEITLNNSTADHISSKSHTFNFIILTGPSCGFNMIQSEQTQNTVKTKFRKYSSCKTCS